MLSDTKLSIFNFPLNFAELLRLLVFKSNTIPLRILDQNEYEKKIVSLRKEQMMNGTTAVATAPTVKANTNSKANRPSGTSVEGPNSGKK